MSDQLRGRMIGKVSHGGGQLGQASVYQIQLEDGRVLQCDYIEIASDGFRTLAVDEEVWCSVSAERDDWAEYVVPIREFTPRQLLGLPEVAPPEFDPIAQLWF